MTATEIKWFPLDRLDLLESAIAELVSSPKTRILGIACALGLSGLRVTEVTRALAKQYSSLHRTLLVCPFNEKTKSCQPLKNGVARTIELHSSLVNAIDEHRAESPSESKYLFATRNGTPFKSQRISAAGRDLLIRLGMINDVTTRFHAFRHTCAMRILAETKDITLVQKHLGHRNIQTTMVYLDCIKSVPESCQVNLKPSQLRLFEPGKTG